MRVIVEFLLKDFIQNLTSTFIFLLPRFAHITAQFHYRANVVSIRHYLKYPQDGTWKNF